MARDRTIRRSQAVHPYGPGAILDWGQECFVVLDTKQGTGWRRAHKVKLARLQTLLRAPDGFRLPPTSPSFGGSAPAIEVIRFPRWLFCPSCRFMVKWNRDQEVALEKSRGDVPRCSNPACNQSILVPMRYIAACEEGHLMDVDWWLWAHSRRNPALGQCDRNSPRLQFLADAAKGSSLEALSIVCDRCKTARRDLSELQGTHALKAIGHRCTGRQPWQSHTESTDCQHWPIALLRSQTAVHFSDVVSALDIQTALPQAETSFDAAMEDMLENNSMLAEATPADYGHWAPLATRWLTNELGREVRVGQVMEWLSARDARRLAESNPAASRTVDDLLDEEWPVLTTPTGLDEAPGKSNLVIRRADWHDTGAVPDEFRSAFQDVLLVKRLREVRAFKSFSRIAPGGAQIPPDLGRVPRQRWLPAIEVFGEGLFLKFDDGALANWETDNAEALESRLSGVRRNLQQSEIGARRFASVAPLLNRFVAVHTFSHLLMRQLCFEAGYGLSAIRERIYVSGAHAGVLIYTADADSEGSLGGLVRQGQAQRLAETIVSALERAAWCSNDPICSEMPENSLDGLNRSACHACSLVPETSCGHINLLLDRQLVIGDEGDGRVTGFLRSLVR